MSNDLVLRGKLLRRPYCDPTFAEKKAMADRIEELEAKLAKAVEAAFYEGFCEGRDGGWVWGDPTPAWEKSEALAELKGDKT